jgi:diguanylate cyclase (GGDEF)-like protein
MVHQSTFVTDSGSTGRLRSIFTTPYAFNLALFTSFVASGALGLHYGFGVPGATLLWAPSGIALGALLVLGYRVWPAVLLAGLVLYIVEFGVVPAAFVLAAGHALESALAAYLINRYAHGRHAFQSPRNTFQFVGMAALACAAVGAPANAAGLAMTDAVLSIDLGYLYFSGMLASLVGMLLAAPAVVLLSHGRTEWQAQDLFEAMAAFTLVSLTGLTLFFRFPFDARGFPIELLCIPVLMWPAFRLGLRAATAALLILAALAIVGTLHGYGPFVRATPFASLTVVNLFLAGSAVMTLAMASLSSNFGIAEGQLRELVVTDPLTGLPNYRRLLEVLDFEIARARRQGRPFAVVFFDMDELKRINDELGHLTGSRAVCRFADTLRASLRDSDTAARYGGDEFVAVLADTDLEGAGLVVDRTRDLLAADTDQPRLSVSAGIAVYPRDGATATTLLSSADRALYAAKAQKAQAGRKNVVSIERWTSAG